jgi:hypothetical protein
MKRSEFVEMREKKKNEHKKKSTSLGIDTKNIRVRGREVRILEETFLMVSRELQ